MNIKKCHGEYPIMSAAYSKGEYSILVVHCVEAVFDKNPLKWSDKGCQMGIVLSGNGNVTLDTVTACWNNELDYPLNELSER